MQKFYFFLEDSPNHPNQMIANSKQDVVNILKQDIREESIISILTESEMEQKFNSFKRNIANGVQNTSLLDADNDGLINPDDFGNATDYMNSVLQMASEKASENKETEVSSVEVPMESVDAVPAANPLAVQNNHAVQEDNVSTKFFEAGGTQFKLERGKVYKKVWISIDNLGSEKDSYRIVNRKSGNIMSNEKYMVEKLEWIEIE